MIKITGLDELSQELKNAEMALETLDGELGTVTFDANDPASIEAAILSVETIINEKLGEYADNSFIGPLAEQMKEHYREAIIDRAAAIRLGSTDV
ncbi:hypothetical protein DBR37_03285 [Herminiimonas sp. KBW02]|uniref:hypothetical protein n=1 Tax=Herminiimonas sp. KBW02 TaxID=2153363 RepID=UPI000F5B0A4E|nr:hypothetical protein [Herminiimonas sp. KBW02]RQO37226.1 hypothetical protein DBR37_03285 [Herminiimonas sp. KBW02]